MTLPTSGAISLSQVNTELGRSATLSINMNDSAVRGLAGVSSGAIAMSHLWGKSSWTATMPPELNGGDASDGFRPGTAQVTFNVSSNPSTGLTYAWTHLFGGGTFIVSTSASQTVRYSSRFDSAVSGRVQCVVTRNGQSRTLVGDYSLTITSTIIGPDV